jgi:hypothetical protein
MQPMSLVHCLISLTDNSFLNEILNSIKLNKGYSLWTNINSPSSKLVVIFTSMLLYFCSY